jgi:hypothetical protein
MVRIIAEFTCGDAQIAARIQAVTLSTRTRESFPRDPDRLSGNNTATQRSILIPVRINVLAYRLQNNRKEGIKLT